jgi:hypothetical protein
METIKAPKPSKAELARIQDDADLALLMKATKRVSPKKEKPVVPKMPVSGCIEKTMALDFSIC